MIKNINIGYPTTISLMTEKRGIAELTQLPYSIILEINKEYNLNLGKNTLYFNRLKVIQYRQKEGTKLITEIIKICQQNKFSIFNEINVYDSNIINLKELINFYCSFNFKFIKDNIVVFIPNCLT